MGGPPSGATTMPFEAVQTAYAERLFGGYRRVIALVATNVGQLQLARYSASRDGRPAEVFSDIDEAFAHAAVPRGVQHG